VSLSMTVSALCTLFSICVKNLWIALAVPMVFDLVLDDNGAFKAAVCAVAALVLGVVGFAAHGCCMHTARGFWRCVVAAGLSAVVGVDAFDRVFLVISPGVDSGTLGSVALGCTLKAVAFLFWLGILGSVPCIDVASTSCVRSRISCSCCAVTNDLRFRMLARLDMSFMILSACDRDGFVMFLCLKCTVLDSRLLWVDLIRHVCVWQWSGDVAMYHPSTE